MIVNVALIRRAGIGSLLLLPLVAQALRAQASVEPDDTASLSLPLVVPPAVPAIDTGQTRAKAVMLSDGFYTRLHIHLIASYAALPVMATEYVLGEKLINDERAGIRPSGALPNAHVATAVALTGLFGLNTVTGLLNLYEERHIPEGRARRTIHSVLMLIADGGFAYTASLGGGAKLPRSRTGAPVISLSGADQHKRAAVISIGVATASTVMMWLWKH